MNFLKKKRKRKNKSTKTRRIANRKWRNNYSNTVNNSTSLRLVDKYVVLSLR